MAKVAKVAKVAVAVAEEVEEVVGSVGAVGVAEEVEGGVGVVVCPQMRPRQPCADVAGAGGEALGEEDVGVAIAEQVRRCPTSPLCKSIYRHQRYQQQVRLRSCHQPYSGA